MYIQESKGRDSWAEDLSPLGRHGLAGGRAPKGSGLAWGSYDAGQRGGPPSEPKVFLVSAEQWEQTPLPAQCGVGFCMKLWAGMTFTRLGFK